MYSKSPENLQQIANESRRYSRRAPIFRYIFGHDIGQIKAEIQAFHLGDTESHFRRH